MAKRQPLLDDQIKEHEYVMLSKYQIAVSAYKNAFAEYGCTVECGLMWTIFPSDTPLFSRISSCRGYSSYVYCRVMKDGLQVNIPSFDGEVDYDSLSCCWQIVSISPSWITPKTALFTGTDDAAADIENILAALRTHSCD